MEKQIFELKREQKKLRLYYGSVVVYLAAAILIMFRARIPGILVALLSPAVYRLVVSPAVKRFTQKVKACNLTFQYESLLNLLTLLPKTPFGREELEATGVVPSRDKGLMTLNGLTGRYHKMSILAGEFSCYHRVDPENPKNTQILFITGTLVEIRFPRDTGMDFRAVSVGYLAERTRKVYFEGSQGLQPAKGILLDFNENFLLYTAKGENIGEEMEREILSLRESSRDNIAVSVRGDRMYVIFQNSYLYPDCKSYTAITAELLRYCAFPELSVLLKMADRCRARLT